MAVFLDKKELTDKIKIYIDLLGGNSKEYSYLDVKFKISNNCCLVLNAILQNPSYWDKYCKLTLKTRFYYIESIIKTLSTDDDSVCYLFSLLFSLVMEKYFRLTESEPNYFQSMRGVVSDYKYEFSESAQLEINHTLLEMPFDIVRENYHDSDIREFADAAITDNSVKTYISELTRKVERQKEEVKELSKTLEEQERGFNFVGLHLGFLHLSKEKRREMDSALKYTKMLGLAAVAPIFIEMGAFLFMLFSEREVKSFYYFIPAFTLTIIILYYFRVSLGNYQSIKAQVNQIELRKTLCRFIQKYSEHAKKMKTSDANSLEKFEALIFSNIIPNEDKIPSTFDGMEQLSNLIKSTKG